MLSIAFSAMIAASLGQLPPAGFGYFPGYGGCNSTGGAGWCVSGSFPRCNRDTYIGCGSWIGAFPSGMACPAATAQWGGPCQGGFCPIQPYSYIELPLFPVQSGALGRAEDEKEHKEINHRLEQLKLLLSKLTDTVKEMEKRVEATEKASLSSEAKIKGLQDELKHRWLLQDIEIRLDQRIKPIEESLKQLSNRLEHLQHEHAMSPDAKKSGAKGLEETLASIEVKIDQLHINVSDQIKKLNDQLNEEKVLRSRLEDRIRNLEKGGAVLPPPKNEIKDKKDDFKKDEKKEEPKKELKKDEKGDILNLSKLKVARVSQVHGQAPADRAVLIVDVPADAKLYLNGQLTKAVGTQRTFVTPELEAGATFVYNLRVEMTRNGELLIQTRTVPFRAGGQAHVVFEGPRMDVQTAGK